MQEPKIKPIFFSIVGGVIISILFLIITFWIFYTYSTSPTAAKDALSTTASFFGGVATLWAACIAAYLFTDWKDQAKFDFNKELIMDLLNSYIEMRILLIPLADTVNFIGYNNIPAKRKLFNTLSEHLHRFYYKQQRLELFFEVDLQNPLFTELELINQGYTKILDPSVNISYAIWMQEEQKLIIRLDKVHSDFYEYLKKLNMI